MSQQKSVKTPDLEKQATRGGQGLSIGLTGGIGCGKSTAGLCLEREWGWKRIDSDQLVRELQTEPAVKEAIARCFGRNVLAASGEIDRTALATIVFSDVQALTQLEALLHPLVRERWQQQMRMAERPVVVEIPLLFEKSLAKWFNFTVCVETGPRLQAERLRQRGLSDEQIQARISRQYSIEEKIRLSDFVLSNRGTLSFLHKQIEQLIRCLPQRLTDFPEQSDRSSL